MKAIAIALGAHSHMPENHSQKFWRHARIAALLTLLTLGPTTAFVLYQAS